MAPTLPPETVLRKRIDGAKSGPASVWREVSTVAVHRAAVMPPPLAATTTTGWSCCGRERSAMAKACEGSTRSGEDARSMG